MEQPVSQCTSVFLPALGAAFTVHRIARCEIRRFGLAQIPVEVSAVRFLQASAQAEIGKLDVTPSIEQ